MENIYLVEKPGRDFLVTNMDSEIVERANKIEALAKKILENSDLIEAYNLDFLRFSPTDLDDEDKEELIAEINLLVTQEKNSYVLECERED